MTNSPLRGLRIHLWWKGPECSKPAARLVRVFSEPCERVEHCFNVRDVSDFSRAPCSGSRTMSLRLSNGEETYFFLGS